MCIMCIDMVQRKNITIRDEQAAWVDRTNVNLSRFVQDRIAEAMGPSEEELAEAYRTGRERDMEVYENWEDASVEANQYLGDAPSVTRDPDHPRGGERDHWESGDN